jgi:predicted aminopeptidase
MFPKLKFLPPALGMRRISELIFVLLFAAACLQCRSLPYYTQAIDGQMDILRKRQPISKLV